jgi:tRNA(Ile)-lysidine synthase
VLEQTTKFIREHSLFTPSDRLLLAVSGGMDSMVMWQFLQASGHDYGVVHCNFRLRGAASDADEAFVQAQAAEYGVPFYSRRFDTQAFAATEKLSIQEAARDLRYAYFEELRQAYRYDYVLTAHHLDDRLETFWLNFTRGTGWRGLASLQAKRGAVRRPLLAVNREQIAAYQQAHKIPFREDTSNEEDKYRRNHFRHHVLPALYAWTPDLAERARTNFAQLEAMLGLYAEHIEHYRQRLVTGTSDKYILDLAQLKAHPLSATLARELLLPWQFSTEQIRQVLTAKPGTLLESPTHVLLVQEKQAIIQAIELATAQAPLTWAAQQLHLRYGNKQMLTYALIPVPEYLRSPAERVLVNPEALVWPLTVRTWQTGDRFCPLGMNDREQKLKDFFINNKIDRLARRQVPLLVNGDGRIIWIVGWRLDERFKVLEGQGQVVEFRRVDGLLF